MTPGLRIGENNEAGADPNVVPARFVIRGASSIMTKGQEGVNAPSDYAGRGLEISVEDLYDLDIHDIEQVPGVEGRIRWRYFTGRKL